MTQFRIQAKNIFLTYAQANRIESKEALFAFLQEKQPTRLVVAEEQHADQGIHYHALLYFRNSFESRNVAVFDFEGHHPNIQAARSPTRTLAYVVKDGNFVNVGFTIPKDEKEDTYTVMMEEIACGNNPTEVIRKTLERTGTGGLRMYNNIAGAVDRLMSPNMVHDPQRDFLLEFNVGPTVLPHVLQFLEDKNQGYGPRGDRKSLWLYGRSRCGKTELARSLGTHWYMCGSWNVDCYSDAAEYGVLDDIDWEAMKRYYKGMMGLQRDITVTDKYKKKSVIKGGKPIIILSNTLPIFTVEEADWLNFNVNFVLINAVLY